MMRQALVMSGLNLLSPPAPGGALIDVFGVACVVAVFVGLFCVVASYQSLLVTGGDDATLMVMKSGNAENRARLPQADSTTPLQRPSPPGTRGRSSRRRPRA